MKYSRISYRIVVVIVVEVVLIRGKTRGCFYDMDCMGGDKEIGTEILDIDLERERES